jgi:hypothetical protein
MLRSEQDGQSLIWRGDDDGLGVFTEAAQDPHDDLASLLDEALLGPASMCDDASIEALERIEHSVARKTKSFGPQSSAVQVITQGLLIVCVACRLTAVLRRFYQNCQIHLACSILTAHCLPAVQLAISV